MDAELKAKWLAALRSGEYAQGKGRLRDGYDRFCCLGVLLDQVDPEAWKSRGGGYAWRTGAEDPFDESLTSLTDTVRLTVGLDGRQHRDLMRMNDVMGRSFDLIADWIDQNL